MADLPNFADRMNDIEVTANAPITETLMRKFGSNINLLLDFLGISNGTTSASGDLSDLSNAISTVAGHTMSQLGTVVGNAGNLATSIGTINSIRFVNQVIIASVPLPAPLQDGEEWDGYGIGGGGNWFVAKQANGTGLRTILPVAFKSDLSNIIGSSMVNDNNVSTVSPFKNDVFDNVTTAGGVDVNWGAISSDFRLPNNGTRTDRSWAVLGEISWREANSWTLTGYSANLPSLDADIYVAYKLNVESAGLIY